MPQTHAHLQGVQRVTTSRRARRTQARNATCRHHGVVPCAKQPHIAARRTDRVSLHACSQTSCFRAGVSNQHYSKSSALRMPPATAAAADTRSLVDNDLKEFTELAEELAQAAGVITQQYFRCGLLIAIHKAAQWCDCHNMHKHHLHTDTNPEKSVLARRCHCQYFCRQPLTIDNKADKSPVTEADKKAERAMRDLISKRFPDHGIFGEEEGMQQPKPGDTQFLWVLDPIDGTKSFITGTQSQCNLARL